MKDMTAREADPAGAGARQLRLTPVEPIEMPRRIPRPALPTNVLIEPAVAVGQDVQPRQLLLRQIHRQRIHVLLPEPSRHHRFQERAVAPDSPCTNSGAATTP